MTRLPGPARRGSAALAAEDRGQPVPAFVLLDGGAKGVLYSFHRLVERCWTSWIAMKGNGREFLRRPVATWINARAKLERATPCQARILT